MKKTDLPKKDFDQQVEAVPEPTSSGTFFKVCEESAEIDVRRILSNLAFELELCLSLEELNDFWLKTDEFLQSRAHLNGSDARLYQIIAISFSRLFMAKLNSLKPKLLIREIDLELSDDELRLIGDISKDGPFNLAKNLYLQNRKQLELATDIFAFADLLKLKIADLYSGFDNIEMLSKWNYLIDRICLDIVRKRVLN
jgi:hypothetical protein